jgi:hypothetical protein
MPQQQLITQYKSQISLMIIHVHNSEFKLFKTVGDRSQQLGGVTSQSPNNVQCVLPINLGTISTQW